MRKLALSDEILMKVDKPARYIGNEFNSVMKDTSQVNIRFAMCFPDVYEIGMSHLGIQILYDMFNRMDDVWCERVYSPWPDLHEIMKQENIPLFGLESQEPIKDFDFVAMTLQYEMCYTNILQILDLAQIPLRSRDREDGCPIVIAGGPCTYNPEPIADFLYFISERVRLSTAISLSFIRRQRLMVFQGKSFYMRLQRLRAFMYLLCMRWSTMRMEQFAV